MHLPRLCAGLAAVVALGMLGWHAYRPLPNPPAATQRVTLWTAGATAPAAAPGGVHLALADAVVAPPTAERVPDLAAVRRRFPALTHLTLEGDGLAPADAAAAAGLTVRWQPPPARAPASPHLVALTAPTRLTLGQRFSLQGHVADLPATVATRVTLEGPDGAKATVELRPAPDGTAAFALASATTATATGAFEWTLRMAPEGETVVLGAEVRPPQRPRLLLLAAAPGQEMGRLQRWLAEIGTPFTARTRLSAERDRFTAAGGAPAEFSALDAALLEKFDLVLADEAALRAVGAEERVALTAAITRAGLGLLVHGAPTQDGNRDDLAAWSLRADPRPDDADQARVARLRLSDGTEFPEPVGVLPWEILPAADQLRLARDAQDRTFVAARRHGLGWIARTLVGETWRWPLGGHADLYAAYWSAQLSALARPAAPATGNWQLADDSARFAVGERLTLSWATPPEAPLPEVEVRSAAAAPVRLSLARDPTEPARATAFFWPTHPGWHTVRALGTDATVALYVQDRTALPGLRRQARHDATARLVTAGPNASSEDSATAAFSRRGPPGSAVAWFALFVASAGYLWREQRSEDQTQPKK